ncbi:MAG: shikimate kinase [Lawsonibacter sp.]|jgi:shikimate dehydrogenase
MKETVEYGLIGEHLIHSFSPAIHRRLGNYDYQLLELSPEELGPFLERGKFRGLNVTIPYKKTVIPYCSQLTPQAARIGSVNTLVRRKDGSLLGHNTDYDGFLYLLMRAGFSVAGKKALVLGSGGASLTVGAVLQDLGAREVVTISRKGPNHYGNLYLHADAQVLVNTTPVGMFPHTDEAIVDLTIFPQLEGVFDLIYNPARTRLLLQAQDLGLVWANGLGMLTAQAKAAAEYFMDQRISDDRVEKITRALAMEQTNIMLVGMPGCGKTTVGRALAQRLGRELADTDSIVEQQAGCSIPELFSREGEEGFRRREHQALCQVSGRSGLIIATGGGIVTRAENLPFLRENSVVFFLRCPLDKLETKGRPLSQNGNLEEMYRRRLPMYLQVADWEVDTEIVEKTVEEIIGRLEE